MRRKRCALATAVVALCPTALWPDAVTDWSQTAQTVMVAVNLRFPLQTRTLAIMHAAIFDAVNSIEHRYRPYAVSLDAPGADEQAAAASAARTVMIALFPTQQPAIEAAYASSLAGIPDGQSKTDGIALGQAAALAILSQRTNDGSNASATYTPGSGPGAWIPTPPTFGPAVNVAWGDVIPFSISSSTNFLPEGPPALMSDDYAADFNEVKALGRFNSAARTADQTHAALFWVENSNLTWNAIARIAVAAKQPDLVDSARLFALLNMAAADAIISGFKVKYIYGFWRPITAIQFAGTDGNNATNVDPGWLPLAVTPLHPDYVSNHSAFSGAASEVLAQLLGDDFAFSVSSSSSPNGVPRSFTSFTAAAEECGLSRIWLGYHFHTAVRHGLNMGRQIGHFAVNHNLQLVRGAGH